MANNATNVNVYSWPYNFGPLSPYSLPREGLYHVGTTQLYELGTRCETWDGRVFRYARAGADRTSGYGMFFYGRKFAGSGDATSSATIAAAIVVGDTKFRYAVTSGQGYAGNGSVAKDVLRGGYAVILGSTPAHQFRMIVGNDVSASGGATINIYVEAAFEVAADSGTTCCIWGNPYYDVRQVPDNWAGCAGIPVRNVTSGQFFWMQTWGPCRTSGHSANDFNIEGQRRCWFGPNGNVRPCVGDVTDTVGAKDAIQRQHAGFLIEGTMSNEPSGYNPLFMLQISP